MGVKGILKGIGINLAVITGICTIIGGTILTFDKFNRCLRSEPHVAIYGTKENPKYKVIIKVDKGKCLEDFATEILPKLELENNDLEKMLKEFDSYLLEFDELEKRTSDLEIKLKETYVSFKNSKEIVEKFKGKPIEKYPSKFKDYFIK
ncbi:MAG: hypothetical protein KKA65_00155 [Nanoarchaeota archaeon]|nr:hypothetical protein [Nanoarchaeota archaeon]MBU4455898.1 hypothetical protein [Nanoarchaeota archaeon]MCG2720235.1 hypothetical protein [Nanoarchaeota archaeon]